MKHLRHQRLLLEPMRYRQRRLAWFLLAVFAAVITPSVDAYSMFLLWLPLGMLYELGIALCRLSPVPPDGPAEDWPEPAETATV